MPSSRAPTAFAAISLLASLARANPTPVAGPAPQDSVVLNAMTYEGCYSSSNPLTDQGSFQYQTNGHCQPICVGQNQAVLALSGGADCWCGDQLPPLSSKVDDSQCNVPCQGFGSQMCGGDGFYSVYLSGTTSNVGHVSGGDSSGSSSSSSSSSGGTTSAIAAAETQAPSPTSEAPTVVTSYSPGKTVVITQAPSSETQDPSASKQSKSGGSNVAGIAAGVVVGVVAIIAIVGGIFLWRRHQSRKESENEYKQTQVSSFIAGGGERKPPGTGWSQMSDSRLDPEAGKRFSNGSIADNNDYSRRILRVANPS